MTRNELYAQITETQTALRQLYKDDVLDPEYSDNIERNAEIEEIYNGIWKAARALLEAKKSLAAYNEKYPNA